MYRPRPAWQRDSHASRSDAPCTVNRASRPRVNRPPVRSPGGHTAHRTASLSTAGPRKTPAPARCAASGRRCASSILCSHSYCQPQHTQCWGCRGATGTHGNLLSPLRGRPERREPQVPSASIRCARRGTPDARLRPLNPSCNAPKAAPVLLSTLGYGWGMHPGQFDLIPRRRALSRRGRPTRVRDSRRGPDVA